MFRKGLRAMSRFAGVVLLIVFTMVLVGCGSDDATDATAIDSHPAHPDNAVVVGRVVAADNVAMTLGRAIITEATTGRSVEANAVGVFRLDGLPASSATPLIVDVPRAPDYQSARVPVTTLAGKTTTVILALLPATVGTPTALYIDPSGSSAPAIEQGGLLQFSASIYAGNNKKQEGLQPTWLLSGDNVGTIDAAGALRASKSGSARVTAVAGNLVQTTAVEVVGAQPPTISSVLISASTDLPVGASGGPVMMTCAASDGNGIRLFDKGAYRALAFEIYTPAGELVRLVPGYPVAGTVETVLDVDSALVSVCKDGTWRLTYTVPANSNVPGTDGTQAAQTYSVRVAARDVSGTVRYSEFHDFIVKGLDTPPPPEL